MKNENLSVVVGAGLAGSAAARVLAESGMRVVVIEKLSHVAGHCHDMKNEEGITVHTYGPHIFHTNNREVWQFVNRFTDFNYYQHKVLSYADGRMIPFPINRDTIAEVFGLTLSTNEVQRFLSEEVARSQFSDPPRNFKDAVVSQVGERLYELFFKNYTIKQWERDPELLSPEVARRIPVRENRDSRYFTDKYQGIPSEGYTRMIERMLDHPNIEVRLSTDYFDVEKEFIASMIVYTGPLDKYFDHEYGELEYRSLELEFRTFDQEFYQTVATVNYPNDYDWTRITEFKHFLGEKSKRTTVCFEYPKSSGEPYYIVMSDDNLEKREKYMRRVAELEATGKVLFIGRLAEYKYYNMDQVIAESLSKTQQWLQAK